jgi:hypothetical protein
MAKKYLYKQIRAILMNNEQSRDNVLLVIKSVHDFEMLLMNKTKADYYDMFFDKKLSSVKTIDREWRKIQEMHPELRGKEWEVRQYNAGLIALQFLSNKKQLSLFNDF